MLIVDSRKLKKSTVIHDEAGQIRDDVMELALAMAVAGIREITQYNFKDLYIRIRVIVKTNPRENSLGSGITCDFINKHIGLTVNTESISILRFAHNVMRTLVNAVVAEEDAKIIESGGVGDANEWDFGTTAENIDGQFQAYSSTGR